MLVWVTMIWGIRQSGAEKAVQPSIMLPGNTGMHCSARVYKCHNDVQASLNTQGGLQSGVALGEAC